MQENFDRREFVKRFMLAGAGLLAGTSLSEAMEKLGQTEYALCAVKGDRLFENTMKGVDALGGMRKFVRPGNTVGILINSPWGNKGTYTNPDISLAVVQMCLDAGAQQIYVLHDTEQRYWKRSGLYEKMRSTIDHIRYSDEMKEVTIDKGTLLKAAKVSATLLSCDVFINIPIIKDHEGTRFTCTLKNMMGTCSGSTCRRMHFGDSPELLNIFKGYYSNVDRLAHSIADLNLVRRPDLCVVDATEILTTNGPGGPGKIQMPREVIIATNCVAADMYATRHLGLQWEDLLVVRYAQEHGYGPKRLQEIRIQTI